RRVAEVLALMGDSLIMLWQALWEGQYPQARHGCSAYLRKIHALSTKVQTPGLYLFKMHTNLYDLR
ncbi:hypothetical protein KQH89_01580, partial [Vibrio cholerae]|uniref:hypothetical protein n=1 Tax=Vibrio cholerae TaxID=666 RepID=UPI001C0FE17D